MPDYRVYIMDTDDNIAGVEVLICTDDATAITAATPFVDGHDAEVWDGTRKVARLIHSRGVLRHARGSSAHLR